MGRLRHSVPLAILLLLALVCVACGVVAPTDTLKGLAGFEVTPEGSESITSPDGESVSLDAALTAN
jgi:hypothetical protein